MVDQHHWVRWHDDYDRPGSSLAQRLRAVQRRVSDALDEAPPGPVQVLSMCAGQGRDVIDVVAGHPRKSDVHGRLVELDPQLALQARERCATNGLTQLTVVQGDAGVSDAYAGAVPADVLLICGVFGNISDGDIRRTINALPRLLRQGGTVIWTRHRRDPDLTPHIREWLVAAGFDERGFDGAAGQLFAVGTNVLRGAEQEFDAHQHLFHFSGDGSDAAW